MDGKRGGEEDDGMLELRGISKSFGDFVAVDDVDLKIDRGEFVTLLGPSGSGKSTSLYMIAGFDTPTSGEIRIQGQSVVKRTPDQRNIGMVFQRYSLFPHMSVRDNVAFPLIVRKYAKDEIKERVERTLGLVRLERFAERKPSALSGGQQQRVALARALVYEPKILLMDEPLSALDRKLREELQQEIRSLHGRIDTTIVYVTHDQEEALHLSDRIAVFNEGNIVQVGSGEELYRKPASSFVASFIGASTFMNASVETVEKDVAVVDMPGEDQKAWVPRMEGFESGDEIMVMVRPERMRLSRKDGEIEGTNSFRARVREVAFLGDHVTYLVETDSGITVKVKRADHGDGGAVLAEGAECRVVWNIWDTHVFGAQLQGDLQN